MNDVQKELLAISAALSSLVEKVEKITTLVEGESGTPAPAPKARPARKAKAKAVAKKAKATPKKKAAAKKAAPAAKAAAGSETMLDNIFGLISRSRKGITVEKLKKKTGLEARQVSNALYKLTKKGKIETLSRGLYIKKKS